MFAIESENIVGYQQVSLPGQGEYALLTPTFTDVGGADSIDLTAIAVVKPGATSFTSKTKISVQKMDLTTGGMTDIYRYTTVGGGKWIGPSADVTVGQVTLKEGEGLCVFNNDSAGSALSFQFSGTVELKPVSMNIPVGNYSIVGNCTPVTVDLTKVTPKGANGTALGTSKTKISIQKIIASTGGMGDLYRYTTAGGGKWIGPGNVDVTAGQVEFAPGEAMSIYNGDTKVISIAFPNPLTGEVE